MRLRSSKISNDKRRSRPLSNAKRMQTKFQSACFGVVNPWPSQRSYPDLCGSRANSPILSMWHSTIENQLANFLQGDLARLWCVPIVNLHVADKTTNCLGDRRRFPSQSKYPAERRRIQIQGLHSDEDWPCAPNVDRIGWNETSRPFRESTEKIPTFPVKESQVGFSGNRMDPVQPLIRAVVLLRCYLNPLVNEGAFRGE
jgi:hypothetical protein